MTRDEGLSLCEAPFFSDVADGSEDSMAVWLKGSSGRRIRAARLGLGPKGTVLLFTGRTEFVEKYAPMGAALAARGFGSASLDWQGQGLSDRGLPNGPGYVDEFAEYQEEVGLLMQALPALGLQGPVFLIAHSMGGCIGLRSLMDGLPAKAAVFTGPMWGIALGLLIQPVSTLITGTARRLGLGQRYAVGTDPVTYVLAHEFDGNTLTSDAERYAWMRRQLTAHPELALGGPSFHWVHEAIVEGRALARRPSPNLPCLTITGEEEVIVDKSAIRDRMARWPSGKAEWWPGVRHEVNMDVPEVRERLYDSAAKLFDAQL